MEWLSENWVFVLFLGAMIGMHLFGHGGHGGGHRHDDRADDRRAAGDRRAEPQPGAGHRH